MTDLNYSLINRLIGEIIYRSMIITTVKASLNQQNTGVIFLASASWTSEDLVLNQKSFNIIN